MSELSRVEDLLKTGVEEPVLPMSRLEAILRGEKITPQSRVEELLLQYNPSDILIEKRITANGTYFAVNDNADGYFKVVVDTPVTPSVEIEHRKFEYDGTRWFSLGVGINAEYDYEFGFTNIQGSNVFKPFIGNNNKNEGIYLFGFAATDEGTWGYGVGNYFYWNGGAITYGDHVVKFEDKISIDNRDISNYIRGNRTGDVSIGYAPNYDPATEGYFNYAKVYNKTTKELLHHMVPVRIKADNVVYFEGIYDLVNYKVVYQCDTVALS